MTIVQATLAAMRSGNYDRHLPADSSPAIMALLECTSDTRDRQLCYWMLTDVAQRTRAAEIGAYAVQRFAAEKTVKLKVEALRVAAWTSGIEQYDELLTALAQQNSQIANYVVEALGACVGERAETALLAILQAAKEPRAIGNAAIAAVGLARMASPSALAQLGQIYPQIPRKNAYGRVLAPIVFAFLRHPTAVTRELVRSDLQTTKIRELGWAALTYLTQYGDITDVPLVTQYLTDLLTRYDRDIAVYQYSITRLESAYPTELSASVAMLCQHATGRVTHFTPQLRKHWHSLAKADQVLLKTTAPDSFADLALHEQEVARTAII
jgi:hypothetical protein